MSKRNEVVLSPQEVEKQKDKILEIKHLLSGRKNKKAFIETYGCQQNVSDSEIIMGMLREMGFEKTQVYTTLELKMKCGIGKCGRCNVGSKYVCKDGPVFRLDELDELPDEY